jgi:hypothetical protein
MGNQVPISYASQYESLRALVQEVDRVHREEMLPMFDNADMSGIFQKEIS